MGAWGHQPFENDSALDWLAEAEDDTEAIARALQRARAQAYLDVDDGSSAVAAAAIVAAAIDGDTALLPEGARALARGVQPTAALRADAVAAVDAVLGEGSELRALWDEGAEGPRWRGSIEKTRASIAA